MASVSIELHLADNVIAGIDAIRGSTTRREWIIGAIWRAMEQGYVGRSISQGSRKPERRLPGMRIPLPWEEDYDEDDAPA